VISVLTPASRYAAPFIRYLADDDDQPRQLCIAHGPGKFGQQAAEGAATTAAQLGIAAVRAEPDGFPPCGLSRPWDLFSAGVFEQDAELASRALALPDPPRRLCTLSAGVREFARAAGDPEGVFGIAQWFPGSQQEVLPGPSEEEFLRACAAAGGGMPDYPAAQAAAGAVIAAHCARLAGSIRGEDLWAAAASLDTSTLFGGFRIDPASGVQVKHDTVLVQWTDGEPRAIPGSCQATP
jgi:hypothetical protein